MTSSLALMLQLTILLPLLATFAIAITAKKPNLREAVTISTSLAVLYCVINLYQALKAGTSIEVSWWELMPGLEVSFVVEPLGMLFALVASFLWLITTIYAIGYMRGHGEENQTRFYICFALAISAVMGLAFSANLFTLFIFYEVITLSTYPLVTHAGTDKAKQGGRVYLGILLSTSIVFFLLAIVLTWLISGSLEFTAVDAKWMGIVFANFQSGFMCGSNGMPITKRGST